jgi:hypothetical protein
MFINGDYLIKEMAQLTQQEKDEKAQLEDQQAQGKNWSDAQRQRLKDLQDKEKA